MPAWKTCTSGQWRRDVRSLQNRGNKQVASDRKANGGKLNASQKQQINKEQNAASKNIYRKKHNGKTQPQAKP